MLEVDFGGALGKICWLSDAVNKHKMLGLVPSTLMREVGGKEEKKRGKATGEKSGKILTLQSFWLPRLKRNK